MADSGPYDSTADTRAHIEEVRRELFEVILLLTQRSRDHDASKLEAFEKGCFDEFTPKLRGLTYGSEEYKQALEDMGEALRHHYENNRHHPEHHPEGIDGMSLLDIVEMLADWAAAVLRHEDGDLMKSLDINAGRFGMSDQLTRILRNTVREMGWGSDG